jgi:ribonuclease HI
VYTDGSKIGDNVGAAEIIFVNGTMVHQLKFKLHGHCSNNQAEQIAILKVLEKLEKLQDGQDNDKRVAVYTDSKINLDLLQNNFKRNRLIESIRDKIIALTHLKWIMHFGWVKRHAGIERNELVDKLAKEAAVEDWARSIRQNTKRGAYNSSEGKWT